MCGMAGVLNLDGAPVDAGALLRMRDTLAHRGPDDRGAALFSLRTGACRALEEDAPPPAAADWDGGFGFTRLSILDLSRNGHQPMISADRTAMLVCNGEIYNAFDHRPALERAGCVFHSRTDTEVLLHLHARHGFEGMLERAHGMFALALADLQTRRVYLARDRMGIKPLYFTLAGATLLFASEVKAFLSHPTFSSRLNGACVDEFTKFGFISGCDTLLKDVWSVEPGEYVVLEAGAPPRRVRYWDLPNDDATLDLTPRAARDLVEETLAGAVERHLMSDVPVGCQLSGGVDSSLITSLAAERLRQGAVHALSIVHENPHYSEEPWIDRAAAVSGVTVHKLDLTAAQVRARLEHAIWHHDFPLPHASCVSIGLIAEKARDYFTVFLSGEGADELFGGYERFYGGHLLSRPWGVPLVRALPGPNRLLHARYLSSGGRRFDVADWFITMPTYPGPGVLRTVRPGFEAAGFMRKRRALFDGGRGGFIRRAQRYDLRTWLVELLVRQDKMTMAHGIENRVPFLDHRLVELARRLPPARLVRLAPGVMRNTKRVLKQVAARRFGSAFVHRKKIGFNTPIEDYFADPSFQAWVRERVVPGADRRGVYARGALAGLLDRAAALTHAETQVLWFMINFELWAGAFLDRRSPPGRAG